jgi:hypothetical protein
LTVVTKQDLWWPDRTEVERHYRASEYAEVVAEVARRKGDRSFRDELVFGSLVIATSTPARVSGWLKNVEGYDHRTQIESVRRLLETVGSLKAGRRPDEYGNDRRPERPRRAGRAPAQRLGPWLMPLMREYADKVRAVSERTAALSAEFSRPVVNADHSCRRPPA